MRTWPMIAVLAACNVHGSASWSWTPGQSKSSTPAPEPTAEPAPEPDPAPAGDVVEHMPERGPDVPVKLARNDGPAADTEQVGKATIPTGKPVGKVWDGKYVMYPGTQCSGSSPFKPNGPDEQTAPSSGSNVSPGLQCPGSCADPTPVIIANGVATFPVTWLDDSPDKNSKRGYTLSFHRQKVSVPLITLPEDVGAVHIEPMAARHWTYDRRDHVSNQIAISIIGMNHNTDADGHGRTAAIALQVGHDGKFFFDDHGPNCVSMLARTDYKVPVETAGGDDDGDDDGDSGSSPSNSREDSRARDNTRKCKSQCRSEAGECRKSCKGAKCANDCNRSERSCTSSC